MQGCSVSNVIDMPVRLKREEWDSFKRQFIAAQESQKRLIDICKRFVQENKKLKEMLQKENIKS